jgi:hypothetical protein
VEARSVDINYLFLRQQTERSRARTATSDVARRIHEQLADRYERLIEDATKGRVSFVRPGGAPLQTAD